MWLKGCKTKKIRTFGEGFEIKMSKKWLNNHIYALAKLFKQEKMVGCKWVQVTRSRFKCGSNKIEFQT